MKYRKWTKEQKSEIVRVIRAGAAAGGSVKELSKEHGIAYSQYYDWLKKLGATPKKSRVRAKPQVLNLTAPEVTPQTHDGDMRLIIGSPQQLAALLGFMGGQ